MVIEGFWKRISCPDISLLVPFRSGYDSGVADELLAYRATESAFFDSTVGVVSALYTLLHLPYSSVSPECPSALKIVMGCSIKVFRAPCGRLHVRALGHLARPWTPTRPWLASALQDNYCIACISDNL